MSTASPSQPSEKSSPCRSTARNTTVRNVVEKYHSKKRCGRSLYRALRWKQFFNSPHTHVLMCGHRHRVACPHISPYARCLETNVIISSDKIRKEETQSISSSLLSSSQFTISLWANQISKVHLLAWLFCLSGIASSRLNTGNNLVWSELKCSTARQRVFT